MEEGLSAEVVVIVERVQQCGGRERATLLLYTLRPYAPATLYLVTMARLVGTMITA